MPSIIKKLLGVMPLIPLVRRNEAVFPYYHVVSNAPLKHIRHLYAYRDIAGFHGDLDNFLSYYHPMELGEVVAMVLSNIPAKQPSIHLTFDDGFRECHDIIAPILKQKGIPATFFICTDFLDNADMFFRNKISVLLDITNGHLSENQETAVKQVFKNHEIPYTGFHETMNKLTFKHGNIIDEVGLSIGIDFKDYLKREQPYLTSDQVQSLIADGFTIGSHSKNHPLFSSLTLAEQAEQVRESLELLQSRFNCDCRAFAFPHTDASVPLEFYNETRQYADIYFGTGRMMKDCVPNSIQRFSMENSHLNCEEILKQNYLLRAFNRITGQNTILRSN